MKIGSVAWGWTATPEDMPVGDSLERIADGIKELGFEVVDYLSDYDSLDRFFTPDTSARIGGHCRSIGLEVGGLVFQSNLWNETDEALKGKQLAYFAKCAGAAKQL
ncbi:MAG: sugar phosphate isomerase/epimerase, partial [Clostridia bacterium]|nr:sugar phosphate isomerase/epimerase [Clostridia bacterium]